MSPQTRPEPEKSDVLEADEDAIVDKTWDETASDHESTGSTGEYLRNIRDASFATRASVSDASPAVNSFDTDLSESTDDFYEDSRIIFVSGDLAGQSRIVDSYTGANGTIRVTPALTSAPADGDVFILSPAPAAIAALARTDIDGLSTHGDSFVDRIADGIGENPSESMTDVLSEADLSNLTLTSGSLGDTVQSNLDATISSRATQADILSDASPFAGANVDAAISTRATPSEVNTEVGNVLNTDIPTSPAAGSRDAALQKVLDRIPSSGIVTNQSDLSGIYKRQTETEGQTSLGDDTETEVFAIGNLNGVDTHRVEGAFFDVVLGDHTQIDLALKVEINGSEIQVGDTVNVTSDGSVPLSDFNAGVPVASPRVTVTATGDNASPTTNGTVDFTVSDSLG